MIKIVHVVNQFFAGLGGEEKAGLPVGVIEGSAGAARGLEPKLGDEGKIACTVYVGDNYFHEHKEEALKAILDAVRAAEPDVLVAGPAFNSGRYGLSCVEICNAVANALANFLLNRNARGEPRRRRLSRICQCAGLLPADGGSDDGDERRADALGAPCDPASARRRDRFRGQRRLHRARHSTD